MFKWWGGAFAFQSSSLWVLTHATPSVSALLGFFFLQGMASALLAFAALWLFPENYRRPRRWLALSLFALNFFAPLLGLAAMFFGIFIGVILPKLLGRLNFIQVAPVSYTAERDREGSGLRGGGARALLRNTASPFENRMTALMSIQDSPTRMTGSLLRELLADPIDDLRLMAYGMLDKREKALSLQMAHELDILRTTQDTDTRRIASRRLAELNWELVYQDLVQGDMAEYTLDQALKYAEQAAGHATDDGPTWMILGRIFLRRGRLHEAEQAFDEAHACGVSREVLVPWLAELRFLQKRYDEVRELMHEVRSVPSVTVLGQMRTFWQAEPQHA